MRFKVLFLDKNHPILSQMLENNGFVVEEDHQCSYGELSLKIADYQGIVIRSRLPMDQKLLAKASRLKFIARVGAGMENIDVAFAEKQGIMLLNAPEGNRDALAEHALAMLLALMNRIIPTSREVKNGIWRREENRGDELMGKTVGIIGYGHMGKAFAKRLSGFGVRVVFHDILPDLSDAFAQQVNLPTLQNQADIISLHLPLTEQTTYLIDDLFLSQCKKGIYLINTARGKVVSLKSLIKSLKNNQIKGACLDVLEWEHRSFEGLEEQNEDFIYLSQNQRVIITPHIAGWSIQSKEKLAQVLVDKILLNFMPPLK